MGQSGPVHDVALGLKDRLSAQTKLREIVAEAERESMGLLDPKSQRQAAAESLKRLIDFYEADLTGRCLDRQHVQNTCYRVRRTAGRLRWHRLADIRPDTFVTFRAKLKIFVGVWKEYGISCQAFCRWLVATGRLAASPLANLPRIEIRGEKVRTARAFAMSELQRLCEVAPARAWIYQVLAYTGMRVAEVRHLEWPSVDLERGCLKLEASETKDREARIVPLHPALREILATHKAAVGVNLTGRVVRCWPKRTTFWKDLELAGIDRYGVRGRVIHWHSFRKTFGTLAAANRVSQRVTQDVLGHSDPILTANIYTDVSQIKTGQEVAKIPWAFSTSVAGSQKSAETGPKRAFRDVIIDPVQAAQTADKRELEDVATSFEMVGDTGLEPVTPSV